MVNHSGLPIQILITITTSVSQAPTTTTKHQPSRAPSSLDCAGMTKAKTNTEQAGGGARRFFINPQPENLYMPIISAEHACT